MKPSQPTTGSIPQYRSLRRFSSDPVNLVAVVIVLLLFLTAIIGPLLFEYPRGYGTTPLAPPSAEQWFGTDSLGLGIFEQVVWGASTSLIIAAAAGLIAAAVGAVLALASAMVRWLDGPISLITDVMLSLPLLPLMIVAAAFAGPNALNLILIIGLFSWPELTRILRAQTLVASQSLYVESARVSGASRLRIMFREILPVVSPLLLIHGLLAGSRAVIAEAGLSFLGLGDPDVWSWGRILQNAQRDGVLVDAWWQSLFPSLAIFLFVLSVTLIGVRLNDARAAAEGRLR